MYIMQKEKMLITVLGCGTSTGVPLIHCACSVCRSKNPKNKRLRVSLWIKLGEKHFLIDASPDLRQQALREKIPRIDALFITHPHADHIGGIDELRSFNFIQKASIPAYGHEWTVTQLLSRFPYIFGPKRVEGGGVAQIILNQFNLDQESFDVQGVKVIPIRLSHGSSEVAGFRIGSFAYLTDCNFIPRESMKRLEGLDVLILDCLRMAPHDTHLHFESSMEYSLKIAAKKTIFTHMSHDFDYTAVSKKLPRTHALAYDGLKIKLELPKGNE